MNLQGKTVLVTGANRGIGQALVHALKERQVRKIYAGIRSLDLLEKTDDRVQPILIDITDPVAVNNAAEKCADTEILINNAGVNTNDLLLGARDSAHARLEMDTNYFGTLEMIRRFAPLISAQQHSAIVNIASITARAPIPMMGSLSASKAALYSLTQSVRAQLAAQSVLVMAVLPGAVDTRMTANFAGDKMPPAQVADAICDALEHDKTEIYPGAMAEGIRAGLENARQQTLEQLAQYL